MLHLHKIMEGLYFHYSLSVCRVCVCVCLIVACGQNSSQTDVSTWTQFSLNGCLPHLLGLYWNWWPCVKGQGHSDVIFFFLHDSLLISLLCISALLCLIEKKFGMSIRYALGRLNFIKIEQMMTSLWCHLRFLQTISHISYSIEHTNFILDTNTQQHDVHLMIQVKLILADDGG